MDWSSEHVLDFGPTLHRKGLRWLKKSYLLWPVRIWRVVTPEISSRKLNILQRAILRFHIAGFIRYEETGKLLGIEPQLVAYVSRELKQIGFVNDQDQVTDSGEKYLDENQLIGDMRVGWIFQDSFTGRILPRFVTKLNIANVESDDNGRPWVLSGSKGSPRRDQAFFLSHGDAPIIQPTPHDIMDASRRHSRHERRAKRTENTLDPISTDVIGNVSLISEYPENYHLLSFIYVPENPEYEDEPWYVADPFGFGASPTLREQFIRQKERSPDGLREFMDRITGEHLAKQRDYWREMQTFLRSDAQIKVMDLIPLELAGRDSAVREKLELAYVDLLSAEHLVQERVEAEYNIDAAYLRLRQSLENVLELISVIAPPSDAWRKLFEGNRWLPKDATEKIMQRCAEAIGCMTALPKAICSVTPNKVKSVCQYVNSSNLRPLCAAFVLAATDVKHHPFRLIITSNHMWLNQVDRIAEIAGSEVHGKKQGRTLENLRLDVSATAQLCVTALTAINNTAI